MSIGTFTNTCTCESWNEDTGEFEPTSDCYGDCWEYQVEDFGNLVEHLFMDDEVHKLFSIKGLPLWNRNVDGLVEVLKPSDLLEAITIRGEWHLTVKTMDELSLECTLSHHDVPMGRTFTVTKVTEDAE